jgi:hypothetical protein
VRGRRWYPKRREMTVYIGAGTLALILVVVLLIWLL